MKPAYTHMAIVIKKHNRKKLRVLVGVAPLKESIGDIYVFPYDYNEAPEILPLADFLERYTIPTKLTDTHFNDVTRI